VDGDLRREFITAGNEDEEEISHASVREDICGKFFFLLVGMEMRRYGELPSLVLYSFPS
jgi:hypothetical protein